MGYRSQTPLHLAALRDKHIVVQYLLKEYEADYNIKDKNGYTPLQLAVKKGQLKSEWTIRTLTSSNMITLLCKMGIGRLKNRTYVRSDDISCLSRCLMIQSGLMLQS